MQWLLTHSFSGKALAVKRVTENQGKTNPGSGRSHLEHPGGQTQGHRVVATARISTAALAAGLYPEGQRQTKAAGNSHDERPRHAGVVSAGSGTRRGDDRRPQFLRLSSGRSRPTPWNSASTCCPQKDSARWILEGDIQGCFDHISHDWMLSHIPTDKAVLQKWLKAGYVENRILFPTEAGTPQGGIISPTLANMTLDGLERLLDQNFPRDVAGRQSWRPRLISSDMRTTSSSPATHKELLENEVKPLVEQFLKRAGIDRSRPRRPASRHIDEGFDFLGQNLRKYGGKCSSNPRRRTRTRSWRKSGN